MSSHQHYHQQTLSVDGSVISHEEFPTTHTHTHTHTLSLSLSLSLSAIFFFKGHFCFLLGENMLLLNSFEILKSL